MSIPQVICEFSPGEGPFDTPSWVDISSRVLSANWSWGRQDELSPFPAGEATIVLRNDDRQLDPDYAAGTWFGGLDARVPFRLRAVWDSVTYDLFYGFVENGFEQGYDPPNWATCTVRLVDILGVVKGSSLPQSAYAYEVLADTPKAYWKLDETSGVQMRDYSGNGFHGLYDNVGLGEDSLVVDNTGRAISCVHVGDTRGEFRGGGLPTAAPVTLEAWVKFPRDLAALHSIMLVQRDSAVGSALWLQVTTSALGSPNGELVINFHGLGGFYKARGHTRVDDDAIHHVVMTMASTAAADIKLYVDGVEQTKTLISGTTGGAWTGHLWWTVGNTTNLGLADFGLGGIIDEAAVYASALSAARILAHYEAGATAFDGESTGTRIDRVLDIIGVPAGIRDTPVGDTFVGPADYSSATEAGQYLSRVVESEQGGLFVNHVNGGIVTFTGRYHRFTATRSTTPQATFTDDPGALPAGSYPYADVALDPNGIDSVINEVNVTWQGGVVQVADDPSRDAYGPQSRSITTEAGSPVAASSAGNWLIRRYALPQTRVRRIDLDPGTHNDTFDAVLDLRVGDRVVVERHPQLVGAQNVASVIVEGARHSFTPGSWTTSYFLSNADDTALWIWGTSEWGETTTWG